MKTRVRIPEKLLCVLSLCFFCALIFSADVSLANKKAVKVGYFQNDIFQEGAQEGAVRKGYAYDYYRKLSEYTGWDYEYIYGSFSDLYQDLLDGEVDVLAGLAKTEEREKIIGYPDLAMGNENYSLVKHASDDSITITYSSLNQKKIGVLDSAMVGVLEKFLNRQNISAHIRKYPDYESLHEAFDEKSVDVMVGESDGTQDREDAELLYNIGTSEYYLCVSNKRPDLLDDLNRAQTQLTTEEPNYINSLRIKYYSESISSISLSSTEKEWLKEHTGFRVGYLNNYLPYSDTDSNGEPTGLISELIPLIMSSLNIERKDISYVGYDNYDDMVKDVQTDNVDMIFPVGGGLYFSEENGIYQSNAVVSSTTELIYSGEYTENTTTHFAVNKNNRMQYYYVKTNFPDAKITFCSSIEECLEAVIDGTIPCTTINGVRANDILKNRSYRELSMKQMSTNDDRCFGVKIGDEGLLRLLNRGINLIGNDKAQNMAYKYVDGLYNYSFLDMVADNIWIFALVVVAIAALIILLLAREFTLSKRANKAKTYFLSTMSHDIRTPMNSILSMNEMILRECTDENILVYAGHIRSSGNTLLGLINDILDFSKIEAGKLDIIPVDYEISSVLNDLVNMVQTKAEEKGLALELHIDSGIPNYLNGDEIRVKQVVTNLLTNAVKYTKEGIITFYVGYDKIEGEDDAIMLNVCIKDTGIGIRKEDTERLFEAFERVDEAVKSIEGVGLGLTITQKLLNLMGSTLHVESEYNKGSEFSFTIKQKVIKWDEVGDYETAFRRSVAERKIYREKFTSPDGRILVVDDTPANLVVIRNLLKKTKLNIDTASSADEGINRASKNLYDIIILDHMMPYKDGIEALNELRSIKNNPNADTPVICLTANAISGMRDIYINAGFDDYLTKPIDPEGLEDAIIRFLPDEKVFPADESNDEPDVEIPDFLYAIDDIDVSSGIEHCGSAQAYLDAVSVYYETTAMNIEEIRKYREADDMENMIVRIHGMKSTARVIGALHLSAFAEELENAGRNGNTEHVEKNLDKFLNDYKNLCNRLTPIRDHLSENKDEKPVITENELQNIYKALKKHLDSADYDEIDLIGEKLESCTVSENEKERVEKITELISMLEYDDIAELI